MAEKRKDFNSHTTEWKQGVKKIRSSERKRHDSEYKEGTSSETLSLDAYSRHKALIGRLFKSAQQPHQQATDLDVLRKYHRFLWEDDKYAGFDRWEERVARKYYNTLYREYCIADLSRYKENKIAMRWRVEKEVIDGKGQFICGAKGCTLVEQPPDQAVQKRVTLTGWQVNFAYMEGDQRKNAIVKLRLCPDCSDKLNFHHKQRRLKRGEKLTDREEDDKQRKSSRAHDDDEDGFNQLTCDLLI